MLFSRKPEFPDGYGVHHNERHFHNRGAYGYRDNVMDQPQKTANKDHTPQSYSAAAEESYSAKGRTHKGKIAVFFPKKDIKNTSDSVRLISSNKQRKIESGNGQETNSPEKKQKK